MDEATRREIANDAANATVSGSGNFFTDGVYPSLIVGLLKFHKGSEGNSFIAEFLVEKGQPCEPGVACNTVGTTASVVYNTSKHKNVSMSNIKALALALAGITEEQLAQDQLAENAAAAADRRQPVSVLAEWILKATGEANPCRGRRVSGKTHRQKRKVQPEGTARTEWPTYVRFSHIAGQTKETIADGIVKLDGGLATVVAPAPQPPPPMAVEPQTVGTSTPPSTAMPPPTPEPPAMAPPAPATPSPGSNLLGSLDL